MKEDETVDPSHEGFCPMTQDETVDPFRADRSDPESAHTGLEDAFAHEGVRAVRLGHGANCSSLGSVVDTLFATAAVGGAVLAAVLAALRTERVRVAAPDPGTSLRAGVDSRTGPSLHPEADGRAP